MIIKVSAIYLVTNGHNILYCASVVDKIMCPKDVLSHVQLCGPMDCCPPVFSTPWNFQARIIEWGAISSSWRSFPTQGSNPVSMSTCTQVALPLGATWKVLKTSTSQSSEPVNMMSHVVKGIWQKDVIKGLWDGERSLIMQVDPIYSHGFLKAENLFQLQKTRESGENDLICCYWLWQWTAGLGEAEKARKEILLLEPPKEMQPLPAPWFYPGETHTRFWPTELYGNKHVLFYALHLWRVVI